MNKKIIKKVDRTVHTKCMDCDCDEKISVIVYVKNKNKNRIKQQLINKGCSIKEDFEIIDALAVDICANKIEDIAKDTSIKYIAPDVKAETYLDIARKTIGAQNIKYTGKGVNIAVIDTGIYPHTDLKSDTNHIIAFKDFVSQMPSAYDDNGHGTHVGGIISGSGKASLGKYKGIAPDSNIIAIKVMDHDGIGSVSSIVKAMEWILKNKEKYNIKIASMSLGVTPINNIAYDPLVACVEKLWDNGIVVIAAAGNSGPKRNSIDSPGISRKIITVGASDDRNTPDFKDDKIASFSSRGPAKGGVKKPDLVAPGVDIISLNNKGSEYISQSGTSMSTPIIAGAAALLLEKEPSLTPNQVKKKLLNATVSLNEDYASQGKGLINLEKLLNN